MNDEIKGSFNLLEESVLMATENEIMINENRGTWIVLQFIKLIREVANKIALKFLIHLYTTQDYNFPDIYG